METEKRRSQQSDEPVLVTGASGFLGAKLVERLAARKQVYSLSRRPGPLGSESLVADLTEGEEVVRALGKVSFACCIHAAALADPDLCEKNPESAWRINVEGTRNLVEICGARRRKLVLLSTDYVFDGRKNGLYTEEDPVCPVQVYGETKAAAERLVLKLPENLVVRLPFLFGYTSPPERRDFATDTGYRLWMGQPHPYDHRQLRTPLLREEAAEGISLLAGSPSSGIYHLAPSESATKYEFARALAQCLGKPLELVLEKTTEVPPGCARRPMSMRLSNAKFLQAVSGRFHFRPLRDAIAGVAEGFRNAQEPSGCRGHSRQTQSKTYGGSYDQDAGR
ncbi:NAD(P)-dependent oxidoreductase [Verrucomicrobium sp. 3C]|uniref:SDR family oxidoreductase n=1 Tax=Verrucomicrobium sp. 3C TaxID=1134055 RepID=UPI0003730FE2|nr:NAD(P)-dependent oxidoreductase [Verrucomicrobium sp. 3C]